MDSKNSYEITEELLNKIISVAYGDASLLDKINVMRAASSNSEVRNLLNSYKTTANEVKQIGEEEFPRELLKSIESRTIPVKKTMNKFIYDLFSIVLSKPIVSAVTSIILIAAIIASLVINKQVKYSYVYTTAEITEAEKQAGYAFAIVSNFFKETHSTLQKDVFGNAVAKPFGQSIRIVNNLLEGDKNETN